MDLIFVKIKDDDGDTDLINVREISDVQPNHGSTGGWLITMTNSIEYIVSNDVLDRIIGAINSCGIIVDCTGNRECVVKSHKGNQTPKKIADSPRNISFNGSIFK